MRHELGQPTGQAAIETDHTATDNVKPAVALLLLLLSADLALILLHLVNVETRWLRETITSLEVEGGLPETFQYLKASWIIVCMGAAYLRTRTRVYASWVAVFAFLLLDDALAIHERAGGWLGQRYALTAPFGLRPDDMGELIVAGLVGLAMLAVVGAAVWRSCEQSSRVARDVLMLVVVLAIPAVLVDHLHVIAYFQRSLLAQVLLVIEDGGEMLVMSAVTAYAFHVANHFGRTRLDLCAVVRSCLRRVGMPAWAGWASPGAPPVKPRSAQA